MRDFDSLTADALSRSDVQAHLLIWIRTRSRVSGAGQPIGLWTGDDTAEFVIDGQSRVYHAAQMDVPVITTEAGISVRYHRFGLSPENEAVVTALRELNAERAPFEVHRAMFEPGGTAMLADPHAYLRGTIDRLSIPLAADGGSMVWDVEIASAARSLTRGLTVKKSDAALRRRAPSDTFRRFAALAGSVTVNWGSESGGGGGGQSSMPAGWGRPRNGR